MHRSPVIPALFALLLSGCGSGNPFPPDVPTSSPPVVTRVDPNAGAAGDPITIFGFGFTVSIPENIVIIGGVPTSATAYILLDPPADGEIEALSATVPEEAAFGEGPIFVQVHGDQSNSDVSFTVIP